MDANSARMEGLAARMEASKANEPDLAREVAACFSQFMPATGTQGAVVAADLQSSDQVLHLIDALAPGWSIRLKGKAFEPDGHWSCTLRPSETRDEDEFIGHAKGPHLANAMIGALLRVLAWRISRAK